MALTVDHLCIDHRVTILREFTDAPGSTMRVGQVGILRGLTYNQIQAIVTMEIELETGKVAVVLPLRVQSGPRLGHMKEFFELGDYVPVPGTERIRSAPPAEIIVAPRAEIRAEPKSGSDEWWLADPGMDGPDRREDLEDAMRNAFDNIGVAHSIAEMYANRMRAFRRAGHEPRAVAAFRFAVDWMETYASWATSGGEGVALSYARKQFHAALVREFGYDPTEATPSGTTNS